MFWILVVYVGILFLYALTFVSRSQTEEGFYVSSRRLGPFTLSLTIAATTIGGSAIVVTWTLIEKYGAAGIIPDIAGGLGLCLLGVWLARRVRGTGAFTLPELLSSQYPEWLVRLLSIAIVMAQLAWLALSFRALQIMAGLTAWQLVVVAFLTWLYSFVGGQWSVSRTDILQFGVLVVGFFLSLSGRGPSISLNTFFVDLPLIYLISLMFFSHFIGPDVYAKVFSASSERVASRGTLVAGVLKILFSFLILLAFLSGVSISKLNILLFLGVASAILSSVDSIFISSTAILERNVLKIPFRRFVPHGIGILLLILSLGFALSGVGVVHILAAGYTVFLVVLFFPTLSVLISGTGSFRSVWIPLLVFLILWFFWNRQAAFLIAFATGGCLVAVENYCRTKTSPS